MAQHRFKDVKAKIIKVFALKPHFVEIHVNFAHFIYLNFHMYDLKLSNTFLVLVRVLQVLPFIIHFKQTFFILPQLSHPTTSHIIITVPFTHLYTNY